MDSDNTTQKPPTMTDDRKAIAKIRDARAKAEEQAAQALAEIASLKEKRAKLDQRFSVALVTWLKAAVITCRQTRKQKAAEKHIALDESKGPSLAGCVEPLTKYKPMPEALRDWIAELDTEIKAAKPPRVRKKATSDTNADAKTPDETPDETPS